MIYLPEYLIINNEYHFFIMCKNDAFRIEVSKEVFLQFFGIKETKVDNRYSIKVKIKRSYLYFEVTKDFFNNFKSFKSEMTKERHEVERHYERLVLTDEEQYIRAKEKDLYNNQKMDYEILYEAISMLTMCQKRRLFFYYFDELTYSEIGAIEGCSKVAVKESIEAGIKQLRKKIKKSDFLP